MNLELLKDGYPFERMAVNAAGNQLIFHVDSGVIINRTEQLVRSGFAGIALYDYYDQKRPHSAQCPDLLAEVSRHSFDSSLAGDDCIPFLGLSSACFPERRNNDSALLETTETPHPQSFDPTTQEPGNLTSTMNSFTL